MKNDYISEIHKKDKLVLHPYEDMESRGTYDRKLIVNSDNIYLYDACKIIILHNLLIFVFVYYLNL